MLGGRFTTAHCDPAPPASCRGTPATAACMCEPSPTSDPPGACELATALAVRRKRRKPVVISLHLTPLPTSRAGGFDTPGTDPRTPSAASDERIEQRATLGAV